MSFAEKCSVLLLCTALHAQSEMWEEGGWGEVLQPNKTKGVKYLRL